MTKRASYFGGKAGGKTPHMIINEIPIHSLYIEPFAGAAAIFRLKRRASKSFLYDKHGPTAAALSVEYAGDTSVAVDCADAMRVLNRLIGNDSLGVFLYLDPPYLFSTRADPRPVYPCEFGKEEQHADLLRLVKLIDRQSPTIRIAISGYMSPLYARELKDWRLKQWPAMTRGNTIATESLWMNYQPPMQLHDYRYIGDNFREREKYKRQRYRWLRRLQNMPAIKRHALLSVIADLWPEAGE